MLFRSDIMNKDDTGIFDRFDRSKTIHTFFQECCERFPHVVYIMGNHEHYNGDYPSTIGILRDRLGYLSNLNILDKQTVTIDDVTFFGGTLWTDMNKEDPITLLHIKGCMNDFRCVTNSNHPGVIYNGGHFNESNQFVEDPWGTHVRQAKFSPEDAVEDHKKMLAYIQLMLEGSLTKSLLLLVIMHHQKHLHILVIRMS